jgi:hypothetical protein
MKKIHRYLTTAGCLFGLATSSLMGVQINEVRVDEPGGTDSNEFVELKGDPGESLDGLWYLVLGDHTAFGSDDGENIPDKRGGTVEFAVSLDGLTIPDDGLFLMTSVNMQIDVFGLEATDIDLLLTEINFENSDNVTHMLVRDYTGTEVTNFADQYDDLAVDIDDDDDGVPNTSLPWSEVVDAIGIVEQPNDSDPEEYTYGAAFGFADIGPDGSFMPGMVYRGSDDGLWNIGEFNLLNDEGTALFAGDEFNGPAVDTPGAENPVSPEPVITPSILGFSPSIVEAGGIVTIDGENLNGATSVTIGGVEATFTVIDENTIEVTIDSGLSSGTIMVTTPAGEATTEDEVEILGGGTRILFSEDFEEGLGDFTVVSLASDRDWEQDDFGGDFFAEMSGFGADTASDDWLITPAIDLSGVDEAVLSFASARNFGGPALEVLISTDYDGLNPATATWETLDAVLSEGGYEEVDSGDIDLSAYLGQTVYVAFHYTSEGPDDGQGATYQIDDVIVEASAAATSIVFFEDFEEGLGDFTVVSLASDRDWEQDDFGGDNFAEMSGFGADAASDDWLITPAIDLSGFDAAVLTFASARNFGGPELEVLISTDYDGLNPAAATWETLDALLSEGGYEEVDSGDIDLSGYVGQTVYIAFHYTSEGPDDGQGATYQIDDVLVEGSSAPTSIVLFEDFQDDLGNFTAVSIASDADWEHATFGGNGFAEMSGFGADAASDDWLFSPEVDLTSATAPVLTFETAMNFSGPELEVFISSDYDGMDPGEATWEPVDATLSTGGYEVVSSGEIDLSGYIGETIYLAFRYTSEGPDSGQGATYQVHEVLITDQGGAFAPGWFKDPELDWIYRYTENWAYSVTMGLISTESFPWIYQSSFGFIFFAGGSLETGTFVYVNGQWAFVLSANAGWFEYTTGEWDNFLNPVD